MDCIILGPTEIEKIKFFGKILDVQEYILSAGKFFAENFSEVIIVPDYGLPLLIAKKFKFYNPNGKVIGYIPDKAIGGKKLEKFFLFCDEIRGINGGWFNLNTQLTQKSENIFCLGFSAGVLIEISSIKYNQLYLKQNTKLLIDNRCISKKLMPEIENDINNIIYFKSFDDALNKLQL